MTRVLVLGGGVAGLDIASNLRRRRSRRRFEVTLVDREPVHVWKPMLHTIASGTVDTHAQQTSYVAQGAARGFCFHQGDVLQIDRRARQVTIGPQTVNGEIVLPERSIGYDLLLLALGSRVHDFGTPGVAEHCFTLDGRGDALAFNNHFAARLLRAVHTGERLTVGIVGGGATGVELASDLMEMARVAQGLGMQDAVARLSVVLLDAQDRILAPFPQRVSTAAQCRLERIGINIRTNVAVRAVDEHGFVLSNGSRIAADLKLWAAGIRAPRSLETLDDLDRSPSGQLLVGADLVCPQDRSLLALGDCARVTESDGADPIPATAQAAFQQAIYIGRYLPAIHAGQPVPPFHYRDFGSLVSLGSFGAYGTLGKSGFIRGWIARMGHVLLYRRHQARIHGVPRAALFWLSDMIAHRLKPSARLS